MLVYPNGRNARLVAFQHFVIQGIYSEQRLNVGGTEQIADANLVFAYYLWLEAVLFVAFTRFVEFTEINLVDALKSCSAKLRKSFKTAFIQLLILYMVLPRKINFTQMGRYSDSSEQRFRQLFEREFDWMRFNLFLMRQRYYPSLSIGLLKVYMNNIYLLKRIFNGLLS